MDQDQAGNQSNSGLEVGSEGMSPVSSLSERSVKQSSVYRGVEADHALIRDSESEIEFRG
jgi:hypothetical protein